MCLFFRVCVYVCMCVFCMCVYARLCVRMRYSVLHAPVYLPEARSRNRFRGDLGKNLVDWPPQPLLHHLKGNIRRKRGNLQGDALGSDGMQKDAETVPGEGGREEGDLVLELGKLFHVVGPHNVGSVGKNLTDLDKRRPQSREMLAQLASPLLDLR